MAMSEHPQVAGISTLVTRIQITNDYAIGADVHAWQVQKRRTRKGIDIWEPITWHLSIEQAAESLRERMVRLSGSQIIDDVLAARKNASTVVSQAVAPLLDSLPCTSTRME